MNAQIILKSLPKTEREIILMSAKDQHQLGNYTFEIKVDMPMYHLTIGRDFDLNEEAFEKLIFLKNMKVDEKKNLVIMKITGASLLKNVQKKGHDDIDFEFGFHPNGYVEQLNFFSIKERKKLIEEYKENQELRKRIDEERKKEAELVEVMEEKESKQQAEEWYGDSEGEVIAIVENDKLVAERNISEAC